MLGKLVKGVGCLFLGVLFLSACGSDNSQDESNNGSNTDTKEVKQNNTKEELKDSKEVVEKKEQVDKDFLNKIRFANYVGSEKDSKLDPIILEKFDKQGYAFEIDKASCEEATICVPCYDENGNIYSNIVIIEKLRDYGDGLEADAMGTTVSLSGLPKTISENIVEFNGIEYDKDETVGLEDGGSLFISTERTHNTLIDSENHKFQINYDEKALMEAKKQINKKLNEALSSSDSSDEE